jgi:chromosome segregation ATPase
MTLALAADLIVAVLLIVTIGYSAVLNRRLAALRADKAELQALVEGLARTTASAGAGIATLKTAAETVGRELEARRAKAQALRDDLAYLVERGNSAADRLEGGIRAQRQAVRAAETPAALVPTAPTPIAGAAASRAERDLMRALARQRQ